MAKRSYNTYYHISYWIFIIIILTVIFGRSWGSNIAAFFFIGMLLPIVLGTSYFFNYFLVPQYFLVFLGSFFLMVRQIREREQIIQKLSERLPDIFLRIHRSFIINKERIKSYSYNEVILEDVCLNIGRSYRKVVRESIKDNNGRKSTD